MLDAYKRKYVKNLSEREINNIIDSMLQNPIGESLGLDSLMDYDNIRLKMKSYMKYFINTINSGCISSNIHLIKSEGLDYDDGDSISLDQNWDEVTTGKLKEYRGFGTHNYMTGLDYSQKNAGVIKEILKNISKE